MKSDAAIGVAFGKFAAAGYTKALFTKDLYLAISSCFGFIAHTDRDGFYEARFSELAVRVATLGMMVDDDLREDARRPLTALEQLLRTMAVSRGLVDDASKQLAAETEQRERAELARLKAKYESATEEVDPLS
jgi:hypothetical protein